MKRYLLIMMAMVCMLGSTLRAQAPANLPANLPYIFAGYSGTFQVAVTAAGVPYTGTIASATWTCSDPKAVLAQGSAVGLETVAIPAGDTSTSLVLTVVVKMPDGGTAAATYTVPVLVEVPVYAGAISQTVATY